MRVKEQKAKRKANSRVKNARMARNKKQLNQGRNKSWKLIVHTD